MVDIMEDMPLHNLVSAANKAEAYIKTQKSTHPDQQYTKKKRLLKMSLNFFNN